MSQSNLINQVVAVVPTNYDEHYTANREITEPGATNMQRPRVDQPSNMGQMYPVAILHEIL